MKMLEGLLGNFTRILLLVCVVILALALADVSFENVPKHQLVEHDPDLEKYLREAIENFRDQMKEGIPAIKMPVLDPLELKNLDIDIFEDLAALDLKVKKPKVRFLSIFNITYVKSNLEEFFLELNLTLPEIYMDGEYSINGKLLKILPIYGQGHFHFNVTDVKMFGKGQLGFTTDAMVLALFKLDFIWKNIVIHMDNFLGGGSFSDVLQKILPSIGRDIFHIYKPLIMEKIEQCLTDKVNSKLNEPDVKDITKNIIANHFNYI